MTTKSLTAFLLSLLGGLGMLACGRKLYGGFGRRMSGWGGHHPYLMWEGSMSGHFGLWWPWVSVVAGGIVLVSAIALYFFPRHRRSLGVTILVASLVNLFFGMGGMIPSLLGIAGGVVALSPRETSHAEIKDE